MQFENHLKPTFKVIGHLNLKSVIICGTRLTPPLLSRLTTPLSSQ